MSSACLHQQEEEDLVGKVVRAMLVSHYSKPGVPVLRSKLTELVAEDYEGAQAKKLPQVRACFPSCHTRHTSHFNVPPGSAPSAAAAEHS
jgi:hypothetical protein